jgi:hypothetical protein
MSGAEEKMSERKAPSKRDSIHPSTNRNAPAECADRQKLDRRLDAELEHSFPASDPPTITLGGAA